MQTCSRCGGWAGVSPLLFEASHARAHTHTPLPFWTQALATAKDLKTKEASLLSEAERLRQENRDLQGQLELTTSQLGEAREKVSSLEGQLREASVAIVEEKEALMKQEMSKRLVETQKKLSLQEVQSVK